MSIERPASSARRFASRCSAPVWKRDGPNEESGQNRTVLEPHDAQSAAYFDGGRRRWLRGGLTAKPFAIMLIV